MKKGDVSTGTLIGLFLLVLGIILMVFLISSMIGNIEDIGGLFENVLEAFQ